MEREEDTVSRKSWGHKISSSLVLESAWFAHSLYVFAIFLLLIEDFGVEAYPYEQIEAFWADIETWILEVSHLLLCLSSHN